MKLVLPILVLLFFINVKGEDSCGAYFEVDPENRIEFVISRKKLGGKGNLPKGFWSDQKLRSVAMFLYRSNVRPLFLEALKSNTLDEISNDLVSRFGYAFSGSSIENYVRKQKKYQLWSEILVELGHPKDVYQQLRNRIRSVFRARKNQNLSNLQKHIESDDSEWFRTTLQQTFGKEVSPWAFYQKSYGVYGSHDKALIAFEFLEKSSFSEQDLINSLRKIKEEWGHEYLNVRKLRTLKMDDLDLEEILNEKIPPKRLFQYINSAFGSWENGLKAAGIKLESYRVSWNRYKMTQSIELLRREFGDKKLSLKFIGSLSSKELAFLKPLLGAEITGQALLLQYTRGIGWYESLEKAGVDVTQLRVLAIPDKNNFPLVIQKIAEIVNPSSAMVDKLTKDELLFLVPFMGKPVSGKSVREMATRHYGSWDKALIAADLNPDRIRLRGSANYELLNIVYQKERTELYSNYEALVGKAVKQFRKDEIEKTVVEPLSTEFIYVRNKFEDTFFNLQRSLTVRELYIFNEILKIIEESADNNEKVENIVDILSLVLKSEIDIAPEEVMILFKKIRENQELMDAFLDLVSNKF